MNCPLHQDGFPSIIAVKRAFKFSTIFAFQKDTFQTALWIIPALSFLNSIFHFFSSLIAFSKS
jgi:hypothetical protein